MKRSRCGFTLLETLFALLVVETAILGSIGMASMAINRMASAASLEHTVTRMYAAWDSLTVSATSGSGSDEQVPGPTKVSWVVEADGTFVITGITSTGDSVIVHGARR